MEVMRLEFLVQYLYIQHDSSSGVGPLCVSICYFAYNNTIGTPPHALRGYSLVTMEFYSYNCLETFSFFLKSFPLGGSACLKVECDFE